MTAKPSKISKVIFKKAINKARKVQCRYKISAIGYDKDFNILGISVNSFRNIGRGGFRGVHAEEQLVKRYGKNISYIFIVRTNNKGDILPIVPCDVCKKMCDKLGIRIISIPPEVKELI
jgi:hypothetical protein